MTATLAFNNIQSPSPSRFAALGRGLFARARDVSNNLTNKAIEIAQTDNKLEKAASALTNSVKAALNSSREDYAWMALTVAAGIGAKLGAFAALNIASGGTLTAALVGGAAVGLTKSLITAYRDSKKHDGVSFFSKKTLMTTASTTALSVATFGALGGFESLTGINIAEKIGQGLHHAFNVAAKMGKDAGQFAFAHFPSPSAQAAQISSLRIIAPVAAEPTKIVSRPSAAPAQPQRVETIRPVAIPIEQTAYKIEYAIERLKTLLKEVGEVPKENATALELAQQFSPNSKDPGSLVRALEFRAPKPVLPVVTDVPKVEAKMLSAKPVEIKLPDGTVRTVQMPPRPDIKAEWKLAFDKVHGLEMDRLARGDYETRFGQVAPNHLTTSEIAKLTNPNNSAQYLNDINKKAETLTSETLPANKMRGACLSDLPASEATHQARGRVLANICSVDNDAPIQEGEYITMRDVGEPIHKPEKRGIWQGIRAVFAGAQTPANEFMGEAIGKVEINQMAADKLAISPR